MSCEVSLSATGRSSVSKDAARTSNPGKIIPVFGVVFLLIMIAASANAQASAGCKTYKFIGTYTSPVAFTDIWGDGSNVAHTFVNQLTLHIDGTATLDFTGFPDVELSGGTGTQFIGSWSCRADGKLVMTFITTLYVPTDDAVNHPASTPTPPPVDLILALNRRVTFLFDVTDVNTLTRVQSRARNYQPDQDPSDPAGGTLRPPNTTPVVYKRLVASDADLLAP